MSSAQEEEICQEQIEALAQLTALKAEQALFKEMQRNGSAPAGADPKGCLTANVMREIARLEAEVARGSSQRLAKDSTPERSVLKSAMAIKILDPLPMGSHLHATVVRYIDNASLVMGLGIGFQTLDVVEFGPAGPTTKVAGMPWRNEMGCVYACAYIYSHMHIHI